VALKALTNGLVAAVYTNGLLRVVRASDALLIKEFTLTLEDIDSSKVVKSEIAFKSY
jgi:hypothetical protein